MAIDSGEYTYNSADNSVGIGSSSSGGALSLSEYWYRMYGTDLFLNAVVPLFLILVVTFAVYFKLRQIQTGSTGLPAWLAWLFSPVGEEHSRDTSSHSTASRQQVTAINNSDMDDSRNGDNDNGNNNNRTNNVNNNEDDDDDYDESAILEGFRVNVNDLEEDLDGVPLISTSKKYK